MLGEFFRCKWKFSDSSESFYVAEQVSHHPPISAFFYCNPHHKIMINGEIRPRSRFLGNSAATIMNGGTRIIFTDRLEEEYIITMPNVYARGILFGTMTMELGDNATFTCEKTGYSCDLEFTTKGYFSGQYNGIKGKIKRRGETLAYLSGKWNEIIYIQHDKGGRLEKFFDSLQAVILPKLVAPEEKQEEYESRKLWSKLTAAILARNMSLATNEKNIVEDAERQKKREREAANGGHMPSSHRFFELNDCDEWSFIHEK